MKVVAYDMRETEVGEVGKTLIFVTNLSFPLQTMLMCNSDENLKGLAGIKYFLKNVPLITINQSNKFDSKLTLTVGYMCSQFWDTTFSIKEWFLLSTTLGINYPQCNEIKVFLPGLSFIFNFLPIPLYSKVADLWSLGTFHLRKKRTCRSKQVTKRIHKNFSYSEKFGRASLFWCSSAPKVLENTFPFLVYWQTWNVFLCLLRRSQ